MTRFTKSRFPILAVVVAIAATGCDVFAPGQREFVIRIDSVRAPGAVSGGAAFQILFYGPVGPDGCYRFKEFQLSRTSGNADITAVGEKVDGTCTQMPVYMSGQALTIDPPVTDPFTFRVHQPDGAIMTRTIRAE
jgi:hypothetical protein